MSIIDRTYEQAKDLHIKNYVVHGKTSDHKLYYEAAYTTQVTQEDLEDAFAKGLLLIKESTSYLVPISIAANKVKTVGTVSDAVALVEWTAKSSS